MSRSYPSYSPLLPSTFDKDFFDDDMDMGWNVRRVVKSSELLHLPLESVEMNWIDDEIWGTRSKFDISVMNELCKTMWLTCDRNGGFISWQPLEIIAGFVPKVLKIN